MKYEDIKKMGEAWAQVQEKQRQANVIRAEAMLKFEEENLSAMKDQMEESKKVDEKAPKVAKGKDASVKGIAKASDAYAKKLKLQKNDASNDKSDDGDGMDKVDKKAVKKKFDDRKDKDIDNDGDTDDSDEYLHKRRKAISKNSGSKGKKETEVQTSEMTDMEKTRAMATISVEYPSSFISSHLSCNRVINSGGKLFNRLYLIVGIYQQRICFVSTHRTKLWFFV